MKHTLSITVMLVILFFAAQIAGLAIVDKYIDHQKTEITGKAVFSDLPYQLERPPVPEKTSYVYILIAVLIGTGLVLLLIRFKKVMLWKSWYFLGVAACLTIALAPFVGEIAALVISLAAAIFKVFKTNFYVHNITELLVYGGLAAIFVPIMNLFSVVMLMLLISIYDFIAVWGLKHMVTMAKFQSENKVFAGLMIPYPEEKGAVKLTKEEAQKLGKGNYKEVKGRNAVLGGGDIGFPLLFAGVVMKGLMLTNVQWIGFLKALVIPVFATISLLLLFFMAKKNRFYPAMPFLTLGCAAGYGALMVLEMLI